MTEKFELATLRDLFFDPPLGTAVVMVGLSVTSLSPVGAGVVRRLVDGPASLQELVAEVAEHLGGLPPGGPDAAERAVIDALELLIEAEIVHRQRTFPEEWRSGIVVQ